jgi:hypothetical protein
MYQPNRAASFEPKSRCLTKIRGRKHETLITGAERADGRVSIQDRGHGDSMPRVNPVRTKERLRGPYSSFEGTRCGVDRVLDTSAVEECEGLT